MIILLGRRRGRAAFRRRVAREPTAALKRRPKRNGANEKRTPWRGETETHSGGRNPSSGERTERTLLLSAAVYHQSRRAPAKRGRLSSSSRASSTHGSFRARARAPPHAPTAPPPAPRALVLVRVPEVLRSPEVFRADRRRARNDRVLRARHDRMSGREEARRAAIEVGIVHVRAVVPGDRAPPRARARARAGRERPRRAGARAASRASLFFFFVARTTEGSPPPRGADEISGADDIARGRGRVVAGQRILRGHSAEDALARLRVLRLPLPERGKRREGGGRSRRRRCRRGGRGGGRSPAAGRGRAAAPRALDDDAHRLMRAPRLMMTTTRPGAEEPRTNPQPPPLRGRRGDRSRDAGAGGAEGPEDPAASSRIPLARPRTIPRAAAGGPTPRARERPRPARPARARRAPSGRARPSRPGVTRRDDDAVPNAAAATAGSATPRRARRRE